MGKKVGFEDFIFRANAVHGNKYTYLSLEDSRSRKATIVCSQHGEFIQGMFQHLAGQGCPACGIVARAGKRKDSFEAIVAKAEKIHEDKYKYIKLVGSSRASVEAVCSKHGIFTIRVSLLLLGKGCQVCGLETKTLKNRRDFSKFVSKAIIVHGDKYKYKSFDYTSKYCKIIYDCPNHGEQVQGANNHINGSGCPKCAIINRGLKLRYSDEEFLSSAKIVHHDKYSYQPLEVIDGESYVIFTCKEHGNTRTVASAHLKGSGCKKCACISAGLSRRYSFEEYVSKASQVHGSKYEYVGISYDSKPAKIVYVCKNHGEITQPAAGHLYGDACPKCSNRVSKPQQELAEFITSTGYAVEIEYRFANSRKIFDIAVHDKTLLIEYDGNYWHSTQHLSPLTHIEKHLIAKSNNYRCIRIRSDEWVERRKAVESFLLENLLTENLKTPAEQLEIAPVTDKEVCAFVKQYSMNPEIRYTEAYGLMSDSLCAILRFNGNTVVDYATSIPISKGFNKLLQYYIACNSSVAEIEAYSDDRLSTGDIYSSAGFVAQESLEPDYKLLKSDTLYEKEEITEEQGIYRVYDCGKTKWLLTV